MQATIELTETTFKVRSEIRTTRVEPHEGGYVVLECHGAAAFEEYARCTTFPHAVWMALEAHSREPISDETLVAALQALSPERRKEVLCKVS